MRIVQFVIAFAITPVAIAACVNSSDNSSPDVDPVTGGVTSVIAATALPTEEIGPTAVPTPTDIGCDAFVPDVVPADLPPVVHRLPNQTLTDWVSYSDQFSIFTVLDEQEQSEYVVRSIRGGTGGIGRSVTAQIEETIWTAAGTEAIEGDITMVVSGWSVSHGGIPFPAGGPGRLEVGGRYMAPLVLYEYDAGTAWGIIELSTLILDGEEVAGPAEVKGITYMPVVGSRIGDTIDEVATALACTERDARSLKYLDLLPEAQWKAVQEDIKANTGVDDPEQARLPDLHE